MKKILFVLVTILFNSVAVKAQVMKIYKGDKLVVTYYEIIADKVVFEEYPIDAHEYVDMGLSVMWATCNIGADKPEDAGDKFAWGETEPKPYYCEEFYKYGFRSRDTNNNKWYFIKYDTNPNSEFYDNKEILDASDDAACVNWGGKWRMPTMEECEELINNCTCTYTTKNDIRGWEVKSKINGNSIFFPYRSGGYYWTSSNQDQYSGGLYNSQYSMMLSLSSSNNPTKIIKAERYNGYMVRPVYSE